MVALVIGASGLVGTALTRELGVGAVGTFRTRAQPGLRPLEASDRNALIQMIREVRPEVVYFAAAEPNVDWCETHPEAAHEANVMPAALALEETRRGGAGFVFFSSDYVFDGAAGPYDEGAETRPLSVYGRHKLEVEQLVLAAGATVVRTTTVYGAEQPPGKNFALRLVARLRASEPVSVPSDQFSTPTWADELARGSIAVGSRPGVWHIAGPDFMSRDRFAVLIAETFGLDGSLIRPVPTSQLRQAAARPLLGGLRADKLRRETGVELLSTRQALGRMRPRLEG